MVRLRPSRLCSEPCTGPTSESQAQVLALAVSPTQLALLCSDFPSCTLLPAHLDTGPPCCPYNAPGTLLAQGLCASSVCLEPSFPGILTV